MAPAARGPAGSVGAALPPGMTLPQAIDAIAERHERAWILEALRESGGEITAAARRLGVHRRTLYGRMKKLGLPGGEEPT